MRPNLSPKFFLILAVLVMTSGLVFVDQRDAQAGEITPAPGFKVLEPIRHGNLTVFPVVAHRSYPTGEFLTLDEGLRSGDVVVTEAGNCTRPDSPPHDARRAQRRRAGEPTGAGQQFQTPAAPARRRNCQRRQTRSRDRQRPHRSRRKRSHRLECCSAWSPDDGSQPVSISASESMYGKTVGGPIHGNVPMAIMAQPSVRAKAMADKDQSQVWAEVRKQQAAMETVEVAAAAPTVATEIARTSSYAKVNENEEVRKQVDAVAKPIEQNYQSLIHQLRDRNAVGVVVAVNGRIIWADVFASTDLLEKYWPKLIRSYASEAVVTRAKEIDVTVSRAQAFLGDMEGRKEMIESEPGIYRHTEVTGDGFKAFSLTSLLPKTGFDVHVAKMAE